MNSKVIKRLVRKLSRKSDDGAALLLRESKERVTALPARTEGQEQRPRHTVCIFREQAGCMHRGQCAIKRPASGGYAKGRSEIYARVPGRANQ